jgi:hypothetical protein
MVGRASETRTGAATIEVRIVAAVKPRTSPKQITASVTGVSKVEYLRTRSQTMNAAAVARRTGVIFGSNPREK